MRVKLPAVVVLTLVARLSAQMTWTPAGFAEHDYHGMVTDWTRGSILAFGGATSPIHYNKVNVTHEWDGTRWRVRRPAHTPLSGSEIGMTYDIRRGCAVVCGGGGRLETWEWDGSDWRERSSANPPAPRRGHALAYDWIRGRTVLFGGTSSQSGVPLADTWEWDGTSWRQLQPPSAPIARAYHSMAYDLQAGRVVLFGGIVDPFGNSPLDDTWTWDGTSWSQAQPPSPRPDARCSAALSLDVQRGRLLLHGGGRGVRQVRLMDTWEWDGTAWTLLAVTGPPAREGAVMAYDPGARRTLLLGGYTGAAVTDLWAWDGTTWNRLAAALDPEARTEHGMAFDEARGRAVLFGGANVVGGRLADTWEWDGDGWIQMAPASSPPGRSRHALAYDPVRGRTVLFGGTDGTPRSDTWEWDGSNWTQRFPTVSPPPQTDHAMVWDGARQRVFLYGSGNWEWDGSQWAARPSAVLPLSNRSHALAFDPRRGRVLLFGGTAWVFELMEWDGTNWTGLQATPNPGSRRGTALTFDEGLGRVVLTGGFSSAAGLRNDVWIWDGSAWLERTPNLPSRQAPEPGQSHRMVYDTVRERLFMFGGGPGFADQTWELGPSTPAQYRPYGSGCVGTAGTPSLETERWDRPWQGEAFTVQVRPLPTAAFGVMLVGTSDRAWHGIPLPLPLAAAGMPGCTLLASGQIVLPLQIAAGAGSMSLPIPASAALLGTVFYQQALVADPPSNAAGIILSNAAAARIGRR